MTHTVVELVPIGLELRFVFFGLEAGLDIPLRPAEVERVFLDRADNQASAKTYLFCDVGSYRVTGKVDDYEPDDIWIEVSGKSSGCEQFRRIVALSRDYAVRSQRP